MPSYENKTIRNSKNNLSTSARTCINDTVSKLNKMSINTNANANATSTKCVTQGCVDAQCTNPYFFTKFKGKNLVFVK